VARGVSQHNMHYSCATIEVPRRADLPLVRGRKERGVMAKSGKSSGGSSRSSVTGKFVTSKYAKSHPSTTQTSHKKSK
jgi:hypothetical protein